MSLVIMAVAALAAVWLLAWFASGLAADLSRWAFHLVVGVSALATAGCVVYPLVDSRAGALWIFAILFGGVTALLYALAVPLARREASRAMSGSVGDAMPERHTTDD